jgi:hypothetical protein
MPSILPKRVIRIYARLRRKTSLNMPFRFRSFFQFRKVATIGGRHNTPFRFVELKWFLCEGWDQGCANRLMQRSSCGCLMRNDNRPQKQNARAGIFPLKWRYCEIHAEQRTGGDPIGCLIQSGGIALRQWSIDVAAWCRCGWRASGRGPARSEWAQCPLRAFLRYSMMGAQRFSSW